jgi:molybdopterin-guanine dinucleotide biosynthesis protein A
VQVAELSDLAGAENFFFNVNTPEDLQAAETMLAQH